jgi:hypothetical protein
MFSDQAKVLNFAFFDKESDDSSVFKPKSAQLNSKYMN